MNIFSYGARIVDESLNDSISVIIDESLLSIISDEKVIKDIFKNYDEFITLKDISNIQGKLVINLLNEIKYLLNYKDIYIDEEKSKYLIKRSNISFKKVDSLNLDYDIYEEAIKIVSNKFLSNINVDDILILDFRLDENYYIKDNERVLLADTEKQYIVNINNHLKKIVDIFRKVVPGVNVKTIKYGLYILDIQKRTLKLEKTLIEDINNIFKEFKIKKGTFINEKIHSSNLGIRYYFKKAVFRNKDKLLIVFSAFSNDKPKYNYVNTLSTYDCNKLHILDNYGEKGCYYLGLNGGFEVETAVMSLISKIASENNIKFKNIISIGSSKGGTAALYYGMKYNFGNIIIGAPQYKIGTYLSELSIKTYADEIFGKRDIASRIKYDNLIRLICNNKSQIYLLTSDGDNQYNRVLKSFEYVSDELNLNLIIDKCEISHHNDIAKEFPVYLENRLSNLLKDNKYKRLVINKIIKLFKKNLNK